MARIAFKERPETRWERDCRLYYFTTNEASQMSGWSDSTIRKCLMSGRIQGTRYMGMWMVKPGEITKLRRLKNV